MEEYLAARKDAVGKQMRIYMDNYFKFDPEYSQLDDAGRNAFVARYNVAQGGRIGLRHGTPEAGIKSLDAGAPDITYEGNEGPQAPMKMASAVGDESDEISMELYGKPVKDLSPGQLEDLREYLDSLSKDFASAPSLEDSRNQMSLMIFKKPLSELTDDEYEELQEYIREKSAQGGRIGYAGGGSNITLSDGTIVQIPAGSIGKYGLKDRIYESSKGSLLREDIIPLLNPGLTFNQGGRVPAQEGGLMDLGGMEKDYRNEGGFVPIGGQERADDVPARLSKNEFVFTADAVRSAGGGDIDKGAEVMENVMEHLEQGGQISEDSQGLEGARNMFATAQRLEGVM